MTVDYIWQIMPALLKGAEMTLSLFFLTLLGSLPLGLVVGLALTAKNRVLHACIEFYIWLMRGTPLLLQLIFVFYGLPLVGIVFGRWQAALIAFILNYAAYFAEIFRGGIQAIDPGQYEGAKMLGLTYWQALRKIIIPQVFKIVLPSIGNEVVNLVKDSSLVYVIGLGDLLRAGNIASARDVTLVPLVLVAIIYLILVGLCTFVLNKAEKRISYYK